MGEKNVPKNKKSFRCNLCNYSCSKKCVFDKHLSTAKHKNREMEQMEIKEYEKMSHCFYCKFCNVTCSTKFAIDRHILSAKHKMEINGNKKTPKNAPLFICECGKTYKHSSGLWKHKNKCKKLQEETKDEAKNIIEKNDNEPIYKELLLETMKQMTQMSEQQKENNRLMSEQQKENNRLMTEQQKENNILVTKMTDMMPLIGNNTTTNNTFNLNVFLNDTCKDAMSLEDFIDSIELTLEDYVNTGEKGFVKGISDIVVNKINGLEEHHRPVHCTDLKRQVLYVKNDDKWEKDQDKMNLRNAVNKVAKKNVGMVSVMQQTYDYDDTKNCDDYLHYQTYFYNALGGDGDEKKNEDEIIKNVLKEVTIDKESENN